MDISIYEKESFLLSISNLIMLKAFYDMGITIREMNITSFMVDIQFHSEVGSDILICGIEGIFDNVLFYGCDEVEQLEKKYPDLFKEGPPEMCIVIKNTAIKDILSSDHRDKLIQLKKEVNTFNYSEVTIEFSETNNELIVVCWFVAMFHEVALALIKIYKVFNEFGQQMKEENNGVSDKINGSVV